MQPSEHIDVSALTNVPETLLIPLYFKAKETREQGVVNDPLAVELADRIDYDFRKYDRDSKTQIAVAVRTILFNGIVDELSARHNDLVVVNLGAGLDTRPEYYPRLNWYNIDFPEVVAIRNKAFPHTNATNIAKSILDFSWMAEIDEKQHVLFIAEGVLMYLEEKDVIQLFIRLAEQFHRSYIAFNVMPPNMVGTKHKSVDTTKAPLLWGNNDPGIIETWQPGLKTEKTYNPLNYHRKRWGWMRVFTLFPGLSKGLGIVLMRIN